VPNVTKLGEGRESAYEQEKTGPVTKASHRITYHSMENVIFHGVLHGAKM
jgi:hypothetical protein